MTGRRQFLRFVVKLAGSVAAAGCGSPKRPRAAEVLVAEEPLELGEGLPGEVLTGAITVRNQGAALIHIGRMETGCSCAKASLSESVLLPGGEAEVQVSVRLGERAGPGRFYVRLYAGNSGQLLAALRVHAGIVPPPIKAVPAEVNFGDVLVGTKPVQLIALLKRDETGWENEVEVRPLQVEGSIEVKAARQQSQQGAGVWFLEVRPQAQLAIGAFEEVITVGPVGSQRLTRVVVRGRVVPRHIVSPTVVSFRDDNASKGAVSRKVLLRRAEGQPLGRVSRFAAPRAIQVEELEQSAPSVRRFRLVWVPGHKENGGKEKEVLLWLEGEAEPVVIPVELP